MAPVNRREYLKYSGTLASTSLLYSSVVKGKTNKGGQQRRKEKSWKPGPVIDVDSDDSLDEIVEKAANVIPHPRQHAWKKLEQTAFLHFGVNTFTGREWGTGLEDPDVFHPTNFDPTQWMAALKDGGFKSVILTAKHHDGFCLWPSNYTDHDVASSAWRNGQGNVVRATADAAYEAGLQFGFYLSPADLHELKASDGRYGNGSEAKPTVIPTPVESEERNPGRHFMYTLDDYNRYFVNQLYELLTGYGPVNEVWFDGANPAPGTGQTYNYLAWIDIIRELMPEAVIAIGGPDVRWVGNETGIARDSEWSPLPFNGDEPALRSHSPGFSPTSDDLGSREQLAQDPEYLAWYPAEADTSIRPGWFYHADEDDQVMSVGELIDIFYKSVGRNANLLLNVPPDQRGLLHETDVKRLAEFGERLRKTFDTDLAEGAEVDASTAADGHAGGAAVDGTTDSYWTTSGSETTATLIFDLNESQAFNRVLLQENIDIGQRIESFALDVWNGSSWQKIISATTVGYKRLLRFDEVKAQKIRLRIEQSRANPTLASFGLYLVDAPPDFVLDTSDIAISSENADIHKL